MYLDKQLHQVSEAVRRRALGRAAHGDAEEAADQTQVTAGVCVELLRVPPNRTWKTIVCFFFFFLNKPAEIT